MSTEVIWQSPLGSFKFNVYALSGNWTWNPVGGVYVFAQETIADYSPLYIGKAESFKERLPCHERWDDAARAGATCILACVIPTEAIRDAVEQAMIRQYQPKLNTQHRGGLLAAALAQQQGIAQGLDSLFAPPRRPDNALLGLAGLGNAPKPSAPSGLGLLGLADLDTRPNRRYGLSDL